MKLRPSQWVTIWLTVIIAILVWTRPVSHRLLQERQNRSAVAVLCVGALLTWQLSAFNLDEAIRRLKSRRQVKR